MISRTNNIVSSGSVFPSLYGGVRGGSASFNFGKLLKIIIAVLTALAGSLGIVSCM